jgi:hypothetical protein
VAAQELRLPLRAEAGSVPAISAQVLHAMPIARRVRLSWNARQRPPGRHTAAFRDQMDVHRYTRISLVPGTSITGLRLQRAILNARLKGIQESDQRLLLGRS